MENPLDYNSNPRSVAIGDFNSDTWLDFVVTNRAANNISVFLGSANGTFRQPTTYPTGSYSLPDKIAVADLNNNGRLDIIVAYFGVNSVGIFLGLGDGTFVSHTTISTGSSRPIWIHMAHLDNDTFLDLVTADYGTASITLFAGDGTGNFSYRMRYPTGYDSSSTAVISADLNNDNHLDLVVANSGTNNLGIFIGKGNGDFFDQKLIPTGVHSHPNSVVVGYFNNDKLLDIAVANFGTNNVGVFWNMHNDTFAEQTTYMIENASPYFLAVADINRDEQSDLIAINNGTNNIGVLLGHVNGTFSRPIMFVTGFSSSISAAIDDLNKDDLPDIVIINNNTNSITISFSQNEGFQSEINYSNILESITTLKLVRRQLGSESCASGPSYEFPAESFSLSTGDFNSDGHLDMIVTDVGWKELVVFLGYGNGSFTYKTIYRTNHSHSKLAVADFNNDTHLDIALVYSDDWLVYVDILLGYGNSSFTKQGTYRTAGRYSGVIAIEDFNRDDRADVLVVDDHGIISILLGMGDGSLANPIAYFLNDFVDSIVVGDFNNDNISDIVFTSDVYDGIGISLGYGNGSFANETIYSIVCWPRSLGIGDFNKDAILDVVILCISNYIGIVNVLLGFGNGSFHDPLSFFVSRSSIDVTVGHLNNDNRLDILVVNYSDDNMSIFLGYGNGSFANYILCYTGHNPNFAAVADFNADGRSDIVVANYGDIGISVFISSLIDFTSESISSGLSNGSRLQYIATDDFNNDHILDIVVVHYGTKDIVLLLGHNDGSLKKETVVPLDWNANSPSVTIADFNRDNQLDLAVANSGTYNIDLLFGDGKGGLIRQNNDGYSLDRPPSFLIADDFNHDGQPEIVVAYENTDYIDILIVYDPGNFTDQITYSTEFYFDTAVIGDFNEDQIFDIAVLTSDDTIGILFGHGDGSFTNPKTYATGSYPTSLVVGHLNKDRHLDIVVANTNDQNIGILFGHGNGSFTKQKTYSIASQPIFVTLSDLNNDTFSDIVVLTSDTEYIRVILSYGNGSFARSRSLRLRTQGATNTLSIADFNNDTFMDIIVLDSIGIIHLFFGYGNGSFRMSMRSLGEFSSYFQAIGDFNNDAQLDIVLVDFYEKLTVLLGYGNGSFVEHGRYSVGCSPKYVAVADLNNDNQLDIVTTNYKGNNITVLLGDGTGSFTVGTKYRTGSYPSCVVIGDFNNDTRMDIVITYTYAYFFSILLGKFNQVFKHQMTLITGDRSSSQALATGDFNSDTHSDIIVVNSGTNSLGVFLGHGNGTFSTQISSRTAFSSPSSITVAHLNNDLHLDIVVVHLIESTITIYLGNGNGSFINHISYSTGVQTQPKSISVADFDNDDVLDIIVVNFDSSNVLVFTGDGNGSFTATIEIQIGYEAHPFSVIAGDYNNDKKLDFAVANHGRDDLEIYLQTCSSSF